MAFRGRGGGGSSNVNAGIWMRGRREDYEGWGDVWGIEDIERSFVEVSMGQGFRGKVSKVFRSVEQRWIDLSRWARTRVRMERSMV
jgi:choline dehydrogenase-like flavoprotein